MRSNRHVARRRLDRYRHRGSVIPLVAVSLVTLVGFGALAIDVGVLYNTKGELQRTADAAAMAAAAELGTAGAGDPVTRARAVAVDFASRNPVLNTPLALDPATDVIFGTASLDANRKYVFTPGGAFPNAVQVRARRTQTSLSGPVPAFFASVFGVRSTDIAAEATAVLVPRDIVFVLDLSSSHHYDSSLMHYRLTEIANRKVWESLWDTSLAAQPSQNGLPLGPSFGNMNKWGTDVTDPDWNFTADPGLVKLKRGVSWTDSDGVTANFINQTMVAKGYTPYTTSQITTIRTANKAGTETSTSNSTQKANYRRRVRVALGIDRWIPSSGSDTTIDASEIVNMVPYPSSSSNPSTKCQDIGGSWDGFIDYVSDIGTSDSVTSNTGLSKSFLKYDPGQSYYGNPQLRWRFGLKTLVDFPQDSYPSASSSPGLAGAPEEPMGSVRSAVQTSLDIIKGLDSSDLVGTAAYSTNGFGPSDKPNNLSWLTSDYDTVWSRVGDLQAGMWSSYTNIAQGIDKGAAVLLDTNHSARNYAAKIMVLLTDGNANQTRVNPTYNEAQAAQDALAAAHDARESHDQKIRIYCVSVGADADQDLMEQVAQIGGGQHFHASGDIATYRQQLQDIFTDLGGKRPVVLAR